MAYFYYSAIDRLSGNRQRGLLKAEHIKEAFDTLSGISLVPERVTQVPGFLANLVRTRPYMNTAEMVDFLKGMGHALSTGVPILEILVAFQNELPSKRARATIQEMSLAISQGQSLSEIMEKLGFFPVLVRSFVEIGEATGNLGENMLKAADRIDFMEGLKGQAKRAMIYPIFVALTIMLAVGVWLFVVIPKVSTFLAALNVKLPAFTRYLIYLSQNRMVVAYDVGMFIGAIVGFNIMNRLIKRFFGKEHVVLYLKDGLAMKLPIVGKIIYNYNHFLIASFAGALIGAGIHISQVFRILSQAVDNAVFYRAVEKAESMVREGEQLSLAFRDTKVFSALFNRYIMIGERTGTLDTQLDFLATYYKNRVDAILTLLPKLIEPLMILLVGGIMLAMILAVFMPIYGSISKIIGAMQ